MKGHRQFECPQRAKTFKAAGVKCAVCGDQSHPTRDCPFKEQVGEVFILIITGGRNDFDGVGGAVECCCA